MLKTMQEHDLFDMFLRWSISLQWYLLYTTILLTQSLPESEPWFNSFKLYVVAKEFCQHLVINFITLFNCVQGISVSIHNFTGLGTVEKQSLIYCIWPTPEKGYNTCHLLKYWELLRRLCFYAESGDLRDIPINLLTVSICQLLTSWWNLQNKKWKTELCFLVWVQMEKNTLPHTTGTFHPSHV